MLDTIFDEVGNMDFDEQSQQNEIMRRVKEYNYVPPTIEEALSKGIFEAYKVYVKERK